jgi:hypothetical protein
MFITHPPMPHPGALKTMPQDVAKYSQLMIPRPDRHRLPTLCPQLTVPSVVLQDVPCVPFRESCVLLRFSDGRFHLIVNVSPGDRDRQYPNL